MKSMMLSLVLFAGVSQAENPDEVLIAKLEGVKAGPVAQSMPPIYNHRLTFLVEQVVSGTLKKGETLEAHHSARQKKPPTFPEGKLCVVGLSKARGGWKVESLVEASDAAIAKAMLRGALPKGWGQNGEGKPLSPWKRGAGDWPTGTEGTPVCARSGRPALMSGPDIALTAEPVPPKEQIKWTNPDGDGEYAITVTNTSKTEERVVESLLKDAKGNILWDESLLIVCQGTTYVVPGSDGAGKDALPTTLKPGESVSGVVNAFTLQGPKWPRGGYRIEFQFCLGELGVTKSFYYMSRHHDGIRKKAMGDR